MQFEPQGWRCPNCGSAHAPSVLTCPLQVQIGTNYRTDHRCQCGLYFGQTCLRQPCLMWQATCTSKAEDA
jgi:hypothetical protein